MEGHNVYFNKTFEWIEFVIALGRVVDIAPTVDSRYLEFQGTH